VTTAGGLAAVTAVLRDLLANGLIDHSIGDAVGDVTVSTTAPDSIDLPVAQSRLNLFLYLVTRNAGWANTGLPGRDQAGVLIGAPPLALNLHYVLTAYGAADLHGELLLGYAMQLLHEMPVLTRTAIRNALSPSLQVPGTGLPTGLTNLVTTGLADQVEQIKVTQTFLGTEALSNLWMAFSAPYRPTALYEATVVLVESRRQGGSAPPVRSFTVGARNLRRPSIDQIRSRARASGAEFEAARPIVAGDEVALVGHRLRGESTEVVVGGRTAETTEITDTRIVFPLPADVPAGLHGVYVSHGVPMGDPPTPHPGVESAIVPLTVHPAITGITATTEQPGSGAAPRRGRITVTLTPPPAAGQRIVVLLNASGTIPSAQPANAYRFTADPRPQDDSPVVVPILDVATGTYLVRVRVDDAESSLTVDAAGRYAGPTVVIT
jgi:hypothetical protein